MQCHTLKPLLYSTANPVGEVEVQPVEREDLVRTNHCIQVSCRRKPLMLMASFPGSQHEEEKAVGIS